MSLSDKQPTSEIVHATLVFERLVSAPQLTKSLQPSPTQMQIRLGCAARHRYVDRRRRNAHVQRPLKVIPVWRRDASHC